MISSVITKIVAMRQSLTVIENEIAQYVINNREAVVTSTITTIAKNTNTSEASINRFCKKIGFKGFNSFKVALAQENAYDTINSQEKDESGSILSSISNDYRNMLLNTSALLDEVQLVAAAEAIRNASHIYIYSLYSTNFVALDLEFRLGMVGFRVKVLTNAAEILINSYYVRSNDAVIILAPTILVETLLQAATICKENGATVISITCYDSLRSNDVIDYKFIASDRITANHSASISNNLVYLYITDIIYSILLENDKSLKQQRLQNDVLLSNSQRIDKSYYEV